MFDVMVDEELVQGEMGKKNKKRQGRQDINSRGGMTRDLIPPRECGGWTNGGSTNLISSFPLIALPVNNYIFQDIITILGETRRSVSCFFP